MQAGETALHKAAFMGSLTFVRFLLDHPLVDASVATGVSKSNEILGMPRMCQCAKTLQLPISSAGR